MQSLLEELFFNTDALGLIGPLAIIVTGAILTQKEKSLAIVFFIVEAYLIAQYGILIGAPTYEPYYWHIVTLLFGGILPLAFTGLRKG